MNIGAPELIIVLLMVVMLALPVLVVVFVVKARRSICTLLRCYYLSGFPAPRLIHLLPTKDTTA